MAISYNAGTNTITLNGINTYTLNDIYNADVAGAWGVVSRQGADQFLFECNMVVGGAGEATKLVDEEVGFQIGITGARKTFQTLAGSSFEMTRCLLQFYLSTLVHSFGSWKFNRCTYSVTETSNVCLYMRGTQEHERSDFKCNFLANLDSSCSYYKCDYYGTGFLYYTTGVIEDLYIDGNLRNQFTSATLKNSEITGVTSIETSDKHITFINCVFSSLNFSFANNYLLDEWEFNALVTDKNNNPLNGAAIILKDKNGDIKNSGATGADGKLPSSLEVLCNRYDGTSETKTEYNPFTLTVTKAGYTDYETEITIDHIIKDDQIVLDSLTYTFDDIMAELKKVKGLCLVC